MQVGISYRCIESYQGEGFAGNPYETAYRKMYHQCLCSLLAGWGAEVPFGGGKADSKPVVVSSRLAQLIASGENRALTCLVLRVISDNAKHQGIPFLHTRQSFKILTVPATPQRNGVLRQEARSMEEMSLTHVRQRQLGVCMSNWRFPIYVLFPRIGFWCHISVTPKFSSSGSIWLMFLMLLKIF